MRNRLTEFIYLESFTEKMKLIQASDTKMQFGCYPRNYLELIESCKYNHLCNNGNPMLFIKDTSISLLCFLSAVFEKK